MASDWRECRLGELVEVRHGYAFSGEHFREEPPGDVLLTPGNFRPGGGFQEGAAKYYTGPVPQAFVLSADDLIITMTDLSRESDTLGYPARVPAGDHRRRYLHNQRLGKIIVKPGVEVDKDFLYYLLCTEPYRAEVLASATGTTVKHTSPSRVGRFRFRLPPLAEQRRIAGILGALDDTIELNRRMSQTLESVARSVFKSWFVDFDPVRAKAEGRDPSLPPHLVDLFPDSFQNSELGEIPQGWRVGDLGDVAEHARRGVQPDEIEPSTPYIALEHMPRRCIALSEWGVADAVGSAKTAFRRGEILFGKLRPYFHKVGVAPVDGVCSTDIVVLAPRDKAWFGFVLAHASSDAFVDYANSGSTGTKMPRTSWTEMARYPVALPPAAIAAAFTDQISRAVERVLSSIHEARTLAALRDALLPRLTGGELAMGTLDQLKT